MPRKSPPPMPVDTLPAIVVGLGVALSLLVVLRIQENVFFSGDAGPKFLFARQFANGDFHPDLRLNAPPWVEALWSQGTYPFKFPFVYDVAGRHYMGWPLFFPLLTAPFYALLGFRGLYIVPLAALFATWAICLEALRHLQVGAPLRAMAMFALIFASPLTFYGETYWEHTVGVAAVMGAVSLVIRSVEAGTIGRGIAAGALASLGAWFRSELIVFGPLIVALVWLVRGLKLSSGFKWALSVSAAAVLGLFVAWNMVIYSEPFGLHGTQALSQPTWRDNAVFISDNAKEIWRRLLMYFPFFAAALVCWYYAHRSSKSNSIILFLGCLAILATAVMPVILPSEGGRQWGSRFLLMNAPLACLIGSLSLQPVWAASTKVAKGVLVAILAASLSWGTYEDAIRGTGILAKDYSERTLPAFQLIEEDPSPYVVASTRYASQELAALMGLKTFLLVADDAALVHVATEAFRHGENRFIYLAFPDTKLEPGHWVVDTPQGPLVVDRRPVKAFGQFAVDEVTTAFAR